MAAPPQAASWLSSLCDEIKSRSHFVEGLVSAIIATVCAVVFLATMGNRNCRSKEFCTAGLWIIIVVSWSVIMLHIIPTRYPEKVTSFFAARLGPFSPLGIAMYEGSLILSSNVFSLLGITCSPCIIVCGILSVSCVIYEGYSEQGIFHSLAATCTSITVSLAASSYILNEVGVVELLVVWGLAIGVSLTNNLRAAKRARADRHPDSPPQQQATNYRARERADRHPGSPPPQQALPV